MKLFKKKLIEKINNAADLIANNSRYGSGSHIILSNDLLLKSPMYSYQSIGRNVRKVKRVFSD